MITVAWLKPAPPGVALYRWCRGACRTGVIFSAPSGSKQEDFMDFPLEAWQALQDGNVPAGVSELDIQALCDHMRSSGQLYTSEAQAALKAAERAIRQA